MEFLSMRFKIRTDFCPSCQSKSHAFSYITLLAIYLEKVDVCFITHKTFHESLKCYSTLWYHFKVRDLQNRETREMRRITSL